MLLLSSFLITESNNILLVRLFLSRVAISIYHIQICSVLSQKKDIKETITKKPINKAVNLKFSIQLHVSLNRRLRLPPRERERSPKAVNPMEFPIYDLAILL